ATLDGVHVDNTEGIIAVDCDVSPDIVTLTLDDGTKITGGELNVGSSGVLEVSSEDGATLDGVSLVNSGTVQVDDGATLTLSGTQITGGTINDDSDELGGTID